MAPSEAMCSWIEREILSKTYGLPKTFLAIHGKRYTGKTTAARILAAEQELELVSLADIPKQRYCAIAGIPLAWLHIPEKKEIYRPGLIEYCDAERAKDEYTFIKSFLLSLYCKTGVVCDDMRLLNEFEVFKMLGARMLKTHAELGVRIQLGLVPDEAIDSHPTECALDDVPDSEFTHVVENRGLVYYDEFVADVTAFQAA